MQLMSGAEVDHILKQSRSAIIGLLKENGSLSVEQLAEALGVTKVCVRRHLSLLESDGLIYYDEERHERGRPRYIYHLTRKAQCLFPQRYDELALDLLGQVARRYGSMALEGLLAARADELIGELESELAGETFDDQVRTLARVMSGRGFLAEARRLRDGSYRMRQRHCPTESVAIKYPQICEQELRVYRESLQCEVVRECRIADGDRVCEFRIKPPGAGSKPGDGVKRELTRITGRAEAESHPAKMTEMIAREQETALNVGQD